MRTRIPRPLPSKTVLAAGLLLGVLLSGCGNSQAPRTGAPPSTPPPAGAKRCADYSEFRNAYFGDLHIHTANSFDAYLFGNHMNDPQVAYDFAQGRRIQLNDNARGQRFVQLRQPLDFAAVTDHSEYLGEVRMCTDAEQNPLAYYDPLCVQFRNAQPNDALGFLVWGIRLTNASRGRHHFCTYADCRGAAQTVWEENSRITDSRNDACSFTTFNAYEYSPSTDGTRQHRNIIFRSATSRRRNRCRCSSSSTPPASRRMAATTCRSRTTPTSRTAACCGPIPSASPTRSTSPGCARSPASTRCWR